MAYSLYFILIFVARHFPLFVQLVQREDGYAAGLPTVPKIIDD